MRNKLKKALQLKALHTLKFPVSGSRPVTPKCNTHREKGESSSKGKYKEIGNKSKTGEMVKNISAFTLTWKIVDDFLVEFLSFNYQ